MKTSIPFEYPTTEDGEYTAVLNEGEILTTRRLQLGLTLHQVAAMAGIHFSQYQRLEGGERFFSNCSMKIGLSVCKVLLLNPTDIIDGNVQCADPAAMKAPALFEQADSHRVGRKKIRKDIMELTIGPIGVTVPAPVISALGAPEQINYRHEKEQQRILLSAAPPVTSDAYPIVDGQELTIPDTVICENSEMYSVKCRLVKNRRGQLLVLADLTTAAAIDLPGR